MNNIPEFSVTEFSNLAKNILEENFSLVKIKGEISSVKNFKGHLYFSIKDENYVLNSVCWASRVPYLQIQPEDGIEVIAEGKISTYAKSSISSYQLQVNQIEIKGEGALLKLIENRKKKLEKEGLFDQKNKNPIPFMPENIGVITSPSGAVIMDIIDRIESRFPTSIKLYPVSVQGVNTVKEVLNGLKYFEKNPVDVLIIARGGGGIEDLMPFNDEELIREVYKFKTPIISAIGHETDYTLLDFVADLRAATPTSAAEQTVPELQNLTEKNTFLEKSLRQIILSFLNNNIKVLKKINSIFSSKNFKKIITTHEKNIFLISKNLFLSLVSSIKVKKSNLKRLSSLIQSLDIENILKRGFVLIKDENMKFIKNSDTLKKNKNINIRFFDDQISAELKIKK
jgi:exodeoxyribonuclease VII large subunit